jgi:phenylpropionate dioxygenase-like ring-hydroxylating dioxygenase large terminal subunit
MNVHPSANFQQSYSHLVVDEADDFKVDSRIYLENEIFDEEMKRIFEKTWVYVGHISELERRGDFKTTTVGKNSIIVSHANDGKIYALLNACRHRGNAVCRTSRGTARSFMCPYHGWAYGNNGDLLGVTSPEGYPQGYAKKLGGLIRLRVAVYRGLIFASMDENVPSIEEHLGDMGKYIDLWADLSPEPECYVARPHHYAYDGNWKFQAENGIDGWHARYTHESAFQTLAELGGPQPSGSNFATVGCVRSFNGGFALIERPGITQGMSAEQLATYKDLLTQRHGAERADMIWKVRYIYIFPNMFLFDNLIRVIQPVSVDRTNVISYPFHLRGVPDEFNKARLPEGQNRLGTAGMVAPDDLEVFSSNQTGLTGGNMRWVVLSHGQGQEQRGEGSELYGDDTNELGQRSVYRQWAKLMAAPRHAVAGSAA